MVYPMPSAHSEPAGLPMPTDANTVQMRTHEKAAPAKEHAFESAASAGVRFPSMKPASMSSAAA